MLYKLYTYPRVVFVAIFNVLRSCCINLKRVLPILLLFKAHISDISEYFRTVSDVLYNYS